MKKSMLFAGLFQIVVALALSAPAVAQHDPYLIHVPFSFNVNGQVLPAGEYRIGIRPGALQIHGIDHVADAMFPAFDPHVNRPVRGPLDGELVFHRYGQTYFLAQVWFQGADAGYELFVSSAEREYAKKISTPESVMLAAK